MLYSFDGREPKIGNGTYVSETAILVGDEIIGDNCYIRHGAILREDYGSIKIGSRTAVEEGVIMHAFPEGTNKIGERVTIGQDAILHCKEIGDFAVIGMGTIISVNFMVCYKAIEV